MSLTDFYIRNYRSVRDVWLKLERINVIVGANGTGKSNLYRAIYLLASAANGRLARNIAEEGGMPSVMRSGDYGADKYQMGLSIKFDDLQYDLVCGTIPPIYRASEHELFQKDLEVKSESVHHFKGGVKSQTMKRVRSEIKVRDSKGIMSDYTMRVPSNDSVLSSIREPHKYPLLSTIRQELLNWRFYHHFRTDAQSPLRKAQFEVMTPAMAHDASDFVSAVGTIIHSGNQHSFFDSLEDAFPGANIVVQSTVSGLKLFMSMPNIERLFEARELSDGTLQYLCLLTALHSLNPPSLLVINEPETSIHPDLFEPLARLIVKASNESQIWITTHSRDLSDYILEMSGYAPLEIEKVDGETRLVGVGLGGYKYRDESPDFEVSEDD
ncbi:MAG: AAA family ATPase [Leptolyngbya sp.]|nr:AAA family ATPase [Candidatus Melainabacteria bacterium]